MTITPEQERFIREAMPQYIETTLWSSVDMDRFDDGECLDANYSADDISVQLLAEIESDVEDFVISNWADVKGLDASQVGHDFSLTRNRHGAGFWDRGLGELGDRLTKASHAYGETNWYAGDDGLLYS